MEQPILKHNKSHTGKQCIGPCYKSNTSYLHPIVLDYMMHPSKNTCPTYRWWNENTKKYQIYDECNLDKQSADQNDILNVLLPTLNFDETHFLKLYYNIYTLDSGIEWLTNNISNYYSSIRISECLWRVYGNSSNILTDKFIQYYVNFIKSYWIKQIYNKLKKFVVIQNNTIQFVNRPNDNNKIDSKYKIEIINFIVKKFVNHNNVYTVLYKYIKTNKANLNNIEYHNKNILENFIIYCINNIKNLYNV